MRNGGVVAIGDGSLEGLDGVALGGGADVAALGVEDRYGRIKPGYRANLLALDEDLSVARSFIDGELERFG